MEWDSEIRCTYEWSRWFAWRPVEVGSKVVWLEWIERRWDPDRLDACWANVVREFRRLA